MAFPVVTFLMIALLVADLPNIQSVHQVTVYGMLAVCLILIMMGFCMHWYLYKKKETYLRKLIDARIEDHDKKKESEKYGFKV